MGKLLNFYKFVKDSLAIKYEYVKVTENYNTYNFRQLFETGLIGMPINIYYLTGRLNLNEQQLFVLLDALKECGYIDYETNVEIGGE